MIPIANDTRRVQFPTFTYLLIALNVVMFIIQLIGGDEFTLRYALVPANIVHGQALITILTSMFMHAGFIHIISNMIYLWVFGPALEDVMGSIPFAIFYLLCGVAATVLQILVDTSSQVPNLGASGAIAGVLGGYIVLFPRDSIRVIGVGVGGGRISALILIGFWFILQLISGLGAISNLGLVEGGVAYFAHIGGFIAGLALVKLFARHPPNNVAELT
ncbi:MAG TPA: rhomboid family intramembrane serine protease [Anaerolineae bacterium]|nr:rhomboid family intramembrane serine protease [Anaerolineae bacterium]